MSKHRRNRSNKIIRMPYFASKGNLRFIQTEDMTLNEFKEWEGKYKTVSVNSDDGAIIEMQKSYVYGIDKKGHKSINHESTALFIAACDNICEKEVTLVLSSKEDVRKLRDYLNRYLEDNL